MIKQYNKEELLPPTTSYECSQQVKGRDVLLSPAPASIIFGFGISNTRKGNKPE